MYQDVTINHQELESEVLKFFSIMDKTGLEKQSDQLKRLLEKKKVTYV
jgi:hypothetical protein